MVIHQQNSHDWKSQLLAMGYNHDDIARAYEAGVNTVPHAVDWLLANPSHHHIDTSQQWSLTSPSPSPSPSPPINHQPPPHSTLDSSNPAQLHDHQHDDLKEAARSVDNLVLAQPTPAPPAVPAQPLQSKHDEELHRAMELSRKEQDQRDIETALRISKQQAPSRQSPDQDPELIRAIEESLKDNPDLPKDQNVSWHSQPFSNPIDRVRKHITNPVGLRNIGNTCYLNSLLQVYYYLPEFRRAIMSFRAPDYYRHPLLADQTTQTLLPTTNETQLPDQRPPETSLSESPSDGAAQQAGASHHSDNRNNKLAEATVLRNAVDFVVELQRLFAMMALGNQNCADPTAVTRAMRDDHGKPISIGAQRDASEFNQLFLDIVEKGLSSCCSNLIIEDYNHVEDASSSQSNVRQTTSTTTQNIVKDMFTMKFRQEIWRCSETDNSNLTIAKKPITTNWDTTSIIVNATTRQERNLHDGLEDFVLTQIKYNDGSRDLEEQSDSSNSNDDKPTIHCPEGVNVSSESPRYAALKTVWFTRLPPVVVIYLQRGSYNRETLRAEKVHDQYEFPTRLAFDRYLETNRDAAEAARKEIQAIRKERNYLLNLLDQYKRFPIGGIDRSQEIHSSYSGYAPHDNAKLPQDKSEPYREDFFEAGARIQKRLREAMHPDSVFHAVSNLTPERIESSLDTIEKILDHDRKRCNELEARLQSIKSESDVYRGLDNVVYDLHAVLVHDGAPESGHYWTFINNRCRKDDEEWVKLSDSNVSRVSENEMLSWSLGGNGKASAYCLIYTVADDDHEEMSISEESVKLLPQQTLDEIAVASSAFEKEVELATTSKT